jgi:hypothetical protein
MSRIIHARLDARSERLLRALERTLGWSDSRIIREGIKALGIMLVPARARRIVGLGRFRSGIPDLGSKKGSLKGFGG